MVKRVLAFPEGITATPANHRSRRRIESNLHHERNTNTESELEDQTR
jgi:hypothetical protein